MISVGQITVIRTVHNEGHGCDDDPVRAVVSYFVDNGERMVQIAQFDLNDDPISSPRP